MSKPAVLILGATSDIAIATAHVFAAQGHPLQLAARDIEKLEATKTDLEVRYQVPVSVQEFDVLNFESHAPFVSELSELPGIAICTIGLLGSQTDDEQNLQSARQVMQSNYEGPAHILSLLANAFEERGSGTLVGISSVAGERGRASNYIYGSAKAGFTAFLSGLRNRLSSKGVHVVSVLPGFVATKMTEGMDLPDKLTAQPDEVAAAIEHAILKKRNVIYVRPVWALIMGIIRNIPEAIFKKTSI